MIKNNIILIGASGTGKSTKGKELAKRLGMNFIDFDDDILEKINLETANKVLEVLNISNIEPVEIAQETVGNILQILGSEKFLELEGYMSNNLELGNNTILATSGSLTLVDSAMISLKSKGQIIYLESETNDIESRIDDMKLDRIVGIPNNIYELNKVKKLKIYENIMNKRISQYEKYADITYKRKKEETNKNGIQLLDKKKIKLEKYANIKFSFNQFYKFLKEKGIVKIG